MLNREDIIVSQATAGNGEAADLKSMVDNEEKIDSEDMADRAT